MESLEKAIKQVNESRTPSDMKKAITVFTHLESQINTFITSEYGEKERATMQTGFIIPILINSLSLVKKLEESQMKNKLDDDSYNNLLQIQLQW